MFQGLSEPDNFLMRNRYKRFAGFYLNEDPDALNYDPDIRLLEVSGPEAEDQCSGKEMHMTGVVTLPRENLT